MDNGEWPACQLMADFSIGFAEPNAIRIGRMVQVLVRKPLDGIPSSGQLISITLCDSIC